MLQFLLHKGLRRRIRPRLAIALPLIMGLVSLVLGFLPFSHSAVEYFGAKPVITLAGSSWCDVERYISITPAGQDKVRFRFSVEPQNAAEGDVFSEATKNVRPANKLSECYFTWLSVSSPEKDFKIASRSLKIGVDPSSLRDKDGLILRNGIEIDDSDYNYELSIPDDHLMSHADFIKRYGDDCGEDFGERGSGSKTAGLNPSFVVSIVDRCAIGGIDGVDSIPEQSKYDIINAARYYNYGVKQDGFSGKEVTKFNREMSSLFREINRLPARKMTIDVLIECPACFSSLNGDILFELRLDKSYADGDFFDTKITLPVYSPYRPKINRENGERESTVNRHNPQDRFTIFLEKRNGFYGKDFFLLLSSVLVGFGLALLAEVLIFVAHETDEGSAPVPGPKAIRRKWRSTAKHPGSYRTRRRSGLL